MRRLGVKQRLDPFRRQQRERPVAIRGAEALKDAAPPCVACQRFFEAKNCCESKYSATTAATDPGLMRPVPMAVRGPLIAAS